MARNSVAVDLDGVICRMDRYMAYDKFGPIIPGAREFMERLGEIARVVIHTSRCSPEASGVQNVRELQKNVERFLERNQIPFDEVWIGVGKPACRAYVDDRAVECVPALIGSSAFDDAIRRVKYLCKTPLTEHIS